jgi:glycosyltransferase involved in cell wall biosynthesis
MLGGKPVVTFGNDWTADPTSKHQIIKHLSRTNTVLWLEAAGIRRPNFSKSYDWARLLTKVRALLRGPRQVSEGLHVVTPPAFPYPRSWLAREGNALLYRVSIAHHLRRLRLGRAPIVITFGPQCAPWVRHLERSLLIYYCVDRWTAFEGVDRESTERDEEELCRRADLVIASAEDLADDCRRFSSNVHYIPHGVDYEHFASALQPGDLPAELASIPEPRIGFVGLVHEWVDTELIARLADALPFSFVIIGSSNDDLGELRSRRNVYVLGRKPYAVLPSYSRGFQAAIVPFRTNSLTQSVNPIKLREYAASGLPIVSSPMPEVSKRADIAVCAGTLEEWVSALRSAVESGRDREWRRRQSARVRDEDWSYRAAQISALANARTGDTSER